MKMAGATTSTSTALQKSVGYIRYYVHTVCTKVNGHCESLKSERASSGNQECLYKKWCQSVCPSCWNISQDRWKHGSGFTGSVRGWHKSSECVLWSPWIYKNKCNGTVGNPPKCFWDIVVYNRVVHQSTDLLKNQNGLRGKNISCNVWTIHLATQTLWSLTPSNTNRNCVTLLAGKFF